MRHLFLGLFLAVSITTNAGSLPPVPYDISKWKKGESQQFDVYQGTSVIGSFSKFVRDVDHTPARSKVTVMSSLRTSYSYYDRDVQAILDTDYEGHISHLWINGKFESGRFRYFDYQKVGIETVTVPVGTFKATRYRMYDVTRWANEPERHEYVMDIWIADKSLALDSTVQAQYNFGSYEITYKLKAFSK